MSAFAPWYRVEITSAGIKSVEQVGTMGADTPRFIYVLADSEAEARRKADLVRRSGRLYA